MTPEELEKHKQLALEADKLYASHHYKHYDFLLLLSDTVGGKGSNTTSRAKMDSALTISPTGTPASAARPARARVHALVERQVPPS